MHLSELCVKKVYVVKMDLSSFPPKGLESLKYFLLFLCEDLSLLM